MKPDIPDKKYFKIGEVGRISGLESHVLRFWETEFNEIRPIKDSGNQRLYRRTDVEKILEIKNLLYEEKYTIAGAKEKLKKDASLKRRGIYPSKEDAIKEGLIAIKKGLVEIRNILS